MSENPTQATYTDDEKATIRKGVFGALAYVSAADPGFFAAFKESAAGAKVLSQAPADVQELLQGGLTLPDAKSPEEFRASVIPNLQAALAVVQAKSPASAEGLRRVISAATQEVATASKGVSEGEKAAIDEINAALA